MKKILTICLAISLVICAGSAFAATAKKTSAKTSAKPAVKKINYPVNSGAKHVTANTKLPEDGTETAETLLVSAEWLNANLDKVVLVDCRFASLYAASHIAGAVSAPWTNFVDMTAPTGSEKYGTLLPEAQLAKKIGVLGINPNKIVVCYSDMGDWGQGGWAVAVLRAAGFKNVKLLDGGIYNWKQNKFPLTSKPAKNAAQTVTIEDMDDSYVIYTKDLKPLIGKPDVAIIDVRTPQEYSGQIAPFKEKRRGHLPGSVNIPMDEFVKDNGCMKSSEEILSLLESKGINKDMQIVLVDTCGVRAGFVTMACRYAGCGKACFYDSGFQAWAGDSSLPLE